MGRHFEVRAAAMQKTANQKAKVYSRYSKEILMAAKNGEPDPEMNQTLKKVIERAKANNVPADVIKRAIEKAKSNDTENYSSARYEGFGSGGGVIFGVTGGVTEAVIRRLVPGHDKETLEAIAECGVRDGGFIREFSIPYEGIDLNICVVSGLANARTVMEQVKSGEKNYHLIEVMACRRGCIMGGGQPRLAGDRTKAARMEGIYRADNVAVIKKSDENPMIMSLYEGFLKGKEHELLHNHEFCSS